MFLTQIVLTVTKKRPNFNHLTVYFDKFPKKRIARLKFNFLPEFQFAGGKHFAGYFASRRASDRLDTRVAARIDYSDYRLNRSKRKEFVERRCFGPVHLIDLGSLFD